MATAPGGGTTTRGGTPRERTPQDAAARSGASRSRAAGRRRRRLWPFALTLAVVGGLAITAALIVTGRTVVPGVSDKIYPIHYRKEIAQVAERYDLDPYLVAAVVQTESGYDPAAVSSAGAVGLMQVMPETAEWVTGLDIWQGGSDPELTDPGDNLELGACYLAYLTRLLGGESRPALAAYNAGQGTVSEWLEAAGGRDSFELTDIRFPETRAFVEKVERYWFLYSRIYPDAFAGTGAPSGGAG